MSNLVTYETGLYTAAKLRRFGLLLTLVFASILVAFTALWWGTLGFLR
jgi:di/tricarboxylate transporter